MFQVGWVKADTKAIQAIHDHVITHNQRVTVSHSDHTMWNLHIKGVQREDGGLYMCQINTDPMKSQVCTSPDPPLASDTSIDILWHGDKFARVPAVALRRINSGSASSSQTGGRHDREYITLEYYYPTSIAHFIDLFVTLTRK